MRSSSSQSSISVSLRFLASFIAWSSTATPGVSDTMFTTLFATLPYLLKGAVYTILLSAVTIVFGLVLGCVLGTLGDYGPGPVRKLVTTYVFVLRGLPV